MSPMTSEEAWAWALENEALAWWAVNRVARANPGADFNDLIGPAMAGLYEGAMGNDPSKGKLSYFASRNAIWRCLNEIHDEARGSLKRVRGPDGERVYERVVSLTGDGVQDDADPSVLTEDDIVDRLELEQMKGHLLEAMGGLPPRTAEVVRLHYGEEWTHARVAEKFGFSRQRSYQICRQGREFLSNALRRYAA